MVTTHNPDILRHHDTNWTREAFAAVLALPAALLTIYTAWGVVALATTTYVGYEVLTVQLIATAAGLSAVLAWAGVIALHKSARREVRVAPRRLLVVGLLAALGFCVLAMIAPVGWMAGGAFALAVVSGLGALVGAGRM